MLREAAGLRMDNLIDKRYKVVDSVIEHSMYLYFFLTFLAKGEGIRNILLFGGFILWLTTLRQRKNLYLLREPVSILLWAYLAATFLSVIFSIDPLFSLRELKGELLKFSLLFPMIATVMTDEERLKNIVYVSIISLIFIVAAGYYSYAVEDLEMLKPNTIIVHVWHNRFARYLCILIPISSVLYFIWEKFSLRIVLTFTIIISVIALMLSTSRGGIAAFISIIFICSIYLSKTKGYNFKKTVLSAIVGVLFIGVLSYVYVDDVNKRLNALSTQVYTMNDRTILWSAAVMASMDRPLTGWGYGDLIFHYDEPFKNTVYGKALDTDKDQHNMFIKIFFHQGIFGVITYATLIIVAIMVFFSTAIKTRGIRSYILIVCASIIFGNYLLHSMLTSVEMIHFAFVLGLGMAARGINENSLN